MQLAALDIGEKRIGVAKGDTIVGIASPYTTVIVDGTEKDVLHTVLQDINPATVVVGYPRNQSGESTAQTRAVMDSVRRLDLSDYAIVYQDESLTSVLARQRLESYGKPYEKGDVDALAASIILEDYIEEVR